jgi:hypothetical protein
MYVLTQMWLFKPSTMDDFPTTIYFFVWWKSRVQRRWQIKKHKKQRGHVCGKLSHNTEKCRIFQRRMGKITEEGGGTMSIEGLQGEYSDGDKVTAIEGGGTIMEGDGNEGKSLLT